MAITLPYTLTNGTTANADHVMSNFNTIANSAYLLGTGIIDAADYGLSESASGAVNKTALDNAFLAVSNTKRVVYAPSGNYSITGTVSATGTMIGDGADRTKFFPTTSTPAFDVTLNYGRFGGITIDYTNVGYAAIDSGAVGIRLLQSNFVKIYDILVNRGYRAIQVLSSLGLGYIWQTEFDNVIAAYNKDTAFYINSATDSTTLKFNCCHVFGITGNDSFWPATQDFKGWYIENCTGVVFSNCSMDGGDGDVDGSVLNIVSGHNLFIDTFHLESFTHNTGGTACSPIVTGMTKSDIRAMIYVTYTTAVGLGNTAYQIRSDNPADLILGGIHNLGPINTSGTRKAVYFGVGGFVQDLDIAQTDCGISGATTDVLFASNIFNEVDVQKQLVGSYVTVSTTVVTILNVPARSNGNDSGLFWVRGENASQGTGFFDLIAVNAAQNGLTIISYISSNTNGSVGARTYTWSATSIQAVLTSSSTNMIAGGFAIISP